MALLQGVGVAMAYAAAPMLIVEAAPAARTSEAAGVSSVVRHLFNAIGSQLMAVLLATATVADPLGGSARYPAPSAFELVLALISALSALALIASLALPRRRRQASGAAAVAREAVSAMLSPEGGSR
jgi:MFS family permease